MLEIDRPMHRTEEFYFIYFAYIVYFYDYFTF